MIQNQTQTKRVKKCHTFDESNYALAKQCAQKDARTLSRVLDNALMRYVQSRT
jgi:hypothetical protein